MTCKTTIQNSIIVNLFILHFVKQDVSDNEYLIVLEVRTFIDAGVT